MTFEHLDAGTYNYFVTTAACVLALVFFTAFFVETVFSKSGHRKLKILITLFLLSIVAVGVYFGSLSHNKTESNRDNLKDNISKKYDVDEVKLNLPDNSVNPTFENKQKIYVVVGDETYAFDLSQNRETWEPTLSNVPIVGDATQDTNNFLDASSLLRNN